MNYCTCGCGVPIGDRQAYVHGHNWRGKTRPTRLVPKSIKCACGCGDVIDDIRRKKDGRPYRVKYQYGHGRRGADVYWLWKGGKTDEGRRFKQSGEYTRWRKAIFERDNYTCQICGIRNGVGVGQTIELHPDHILPFAFYPELRTAMSNGRTLCRPCHLKTDTYGPKAKRFKPSQL